MSMKYFPVPALPNGLPPGRLRSLPELLLLLALLVLAAVPVHVGAGVVGLQEAEEVGPGVGQGLAGGAGVRAAHRGRPRVVAPFG